MMIEVDDDPFTCEKTIRISSIIPNDTEHKIIFLKDIVNTMFDGYECEHIREYLNNYKPLTHIQLRNRKIFKAIRDEDLSALNEIFVFSELTSIEKYPDYETIRLNFDTLEIPDIKQLLQLKEDYDVEIEVKVSRNNNDVWINRIKINGE